MEEGGIKMEDDEILQLYWDRDEQAIPATAEKYGDYCSSIARHILESREDAEECVNDTYLKAWNAIPPQRPDILRVFLGTITRNLSFNRYRYNTAHRRGGGEAALVLEELAQLVSGSDHVEQEVEGRELLRAINAFLAGLPPEKRRMFVCRYWYFDPVSEIAARFGISQNQVSVTLSRLRGKLRRHLTEGGFEL